MYFNHQSHYIRDINGIAVTQRELDILACLVNNRGTKKIASILGIAPSTAATHINNIIAKFKCNSRERVIDFLESSSDYYDVKSRYSFILLESHFLGALANFGKQQPLKTVFQIDMEYLDPADLESIRKLSSYLSQTDVQIADKTSIDVQQDTTIIYVVSKAYFELFQGRLGSINNQDHDCILLFLDKSEETLLNTNYPSIFAHDHPSIFHVIFNVLESIFSPKDVRKIKSEFESLYERVTTNETLLPHDTISKGARRSIDWHNWRSSKLSLALCVSLIGVATIFALVNPPLLRTEEKIVSDVKITKWRVPQSTSYFIDRPKLQEAIRVRLTEQSTNKPFNLIALTGFGGVGKTTLATQILQNPSTDVDFRAWFKSDIIANLKAQYFALGERLNLFSDDMSDQLKIILVKEWLESKKSLLLVFDNVPNIDVIHDFLPSHGNIIVTSRNAKWLQKINIDVMNEKQGLQVLRAFLPNESMDTKAAKKLLKTLGYLPIAITQAGSYIRETKINIKRYLDLFIANQEQLLEHKSFEAEDSFQPITTTWTLNLQSITAHPRGKKAMELLQLLAMCDSDNVPKTFLVQSLYGGLSEQSEVELYEVLTLLNSFSLVQLSSSSISMHVLLQDFLKSKLSVNQQDTLLEHAMSALASLDGQNDNKYQHISQMVSLLPHAQKLLDQAKANTTTQIPVDFLISIANIHKNLGNFKIAQSYLNDAVELSEQKHGTRHLKTATALSSLGRVLNRLGIYSTSISTLKKALHIYEQATGLSNPEGISILNKLGEIYLFSGDLLSAQKTLEHSSKITLNLYGSSHTEYAHILHIKGRLELAKGNFQEAILLLERSIAILEKGGSKKNIKLANTLHMIGWAYDGVGSFEKSKQTLEKNLKIRRELWGPDHLETAEAEAALAIPHMFLNDTKTAIPRLENALYKFVKFYGAEHPLTIWTQRTLGVALIYAGKYDSAKTTLETALLLTQKTSGEDHPRTAKILGSLGILLSITGDHKTGLRHLKASHKVLESHYGAESIHTALALGNLGLAYGHAKEFEAKKITLKKTLEILKKSFGLDNHFTQRTCLMFENLESRDMKTKSNSPFFYPQVL